MDWHLSFTRTVFTVVLITLLFGCASGTGPAPVASISTSPKPPPLANLSEKKYLVQKGDTLYSIAFATGVSAKLLAKYNKIAPPYIIYPGKWLSLVNQGTSATPKPVVTAKVSKKWQKKLDSQKKGTYSKNVTKPKRSTTTQQKKSYIESKDNNFASKIAKWVWPAKGRVVSAYSASAQGNKGIDIAGLRGSDIVASAAGKVVYSGNALRGYGNLIIIKHNDDFLSAYAHNDRIFVKEKQRIKQGQVIAKMGDTGSDKVQLHFEIRFRGKSVNPAHYLPKR
ncbi:peptidoglycan DD-metalloendopeptidase family protein [Psychrobium sp. 1_MG-2023]|uniref:peptidoglycan DD-metalloendopeptidase family protein n=1 Tax=Psychrobium sp. 1_MG-2023 TaxID=3062624 RepID=UPI000C3451B7|nr:peptidoglycan DD-metalloendopeptidase family protein [Psychrobium sp. 1_MG-2023]MDP2562384.1 peptidoglycan DD-metalloendopeptidase family protein [Psychrobium sp. 1_MG-2023]PKF55851.1 lipoprotein NlpD [Alteromonadales bacterium alter-6D02]